VDEERSLVTLGGRRLLRAAQHVTRAKLMDPRPQRREEAFRYLRILFERLRAADGLTVQSPRAVEATEGWSFDVFASRAHTHGGDSLLSRPGPPRKIA